MIKNNRASDNSDADIIIHCTSRAVVSKWYCIVLYCMHHTQALSENDVRVDDGIDQYAGEVQPHHNNARKYHPESGSACRTTISMEMTWMSVYNMKCGSQLVSQRMRQ